MQNSSPNWKTIELDVEQYASNCSGGVCRIVRILIVEADLTAVEQPKNTTSLDRSNRDIVKKYDRRDCV